jgi:hypothetical protein
VRTVKRFVDSTHKRAERSEEHVIALQQSPVSGQLFLCSETGMRLLGGKLRAQGTPFASLASHEVHTPQMPSVTCDLARRLLSALPASAAMVPYRSPGVSLLLAVLLICTGECHVQLGLGLQSLSARYPGSTLCSRPCSCVPCLPFCLQWARRLPAQNPPAGC